MAVREITSAVTVAVLRCWPTKPDPAGLPRLVAAGPGAEQDAPGPRRGCPATSLARKAVIPAMVYLPGGTHTMVRKRDLLAVLAALWNVAAEACVPDPGLRQTARLSAAAAG